MNGRCWSFKGPDEEDYTQPSSPGPTLKMIAGTTFTIVLENNFVNSVQEEPECHNSYCEMDMINLHLHGLHISSNQDDVLVDLKPRISKLADANQYNYTYTIPHDHYPGIHWYHPHNQLIVYITYYKYKFSVSIENNQIQWVSEPSNTFWIIWSNNHRI